MFEVHQPFRISPDTHSRPQTPQRRKHEDEEEPEEQRDQAQEEHHLPPSPASGNCIDIVA